MSKFGWACGSALWIVGLFLLLLGVPYMTIDVIFGISLATLGGLFVIIGGMIINEERDQ